MTKCVRGIDTHARFFFFFFGHFLKEGNFYDFPVWFSLLWIPSEKGSNFRGKKCFSNRPVLIKRCQKTFYEVASLVCLSLHLIWQVLFVRIWYTYVGKTILLSRSHLHYVKDQGEWIHLRTLSKMPRNNFVFFFFFWCQLYKFMVDPLAQPMKSVVRAATYNSCIIWFYKVNHDWINLELQENT